MNTRLGLLVGLLVVQLILVGVVFFATSRGEAGAPFLVLDPGAVTGLTISDDAEGSVVLTRSGDRWLVGELPADGDKITDLIEKLTGENANWPVATTEDSRDRFEVSAAKHQRQVDFQGNNGALATIYLGTSPGFRRVHARQEGEDAIYSIDFAVHELPTAVNDWLDKQLLASTDVERIELPDGYVLAQAGEDGAWTLDGIATDPEATRRYLERIERLAVLGRYEPVADGSTLGEARTLVVETKDGTRRLKFRFNESADEYVLETDRYPDKFTVASYIAEQILADPGGLLPKAAGGDATEALPEDEPAGSPEDSQEGAL